MPVKGCLFYLLGFSVLLAVACSQSEDAQPSRPLAAQETYEGTIVAVGDSLTEGLGVAESQAYPARLSAMLRQGGYPYRVVNAGISGETTSGTLARIQWVLSMEPDIVILETGANDGLRGLDLKKMAANLNQILKQLTGRGVVVVLAGMQMLPNLGPEYTRAFEQVYRAAAAEHDVIFMPFFLEGVATRRHLNQPDGLHPNSEGYAVVADNIYSYAKEAITKKRALP